jgi:hypothetical protein
MTGDFSDDLTLSTGARHRPPLPCFPESWVLVQDHRATRLVPGKGTTSDAAGNGLGTTIIHLFIAAGIGLGNTIKYLRGATGIGLGTTIKYL